MERTYDVHKTSSASSERLMYVQFTSCVYWVKDDNLRTQRNSGQKLKIEWRNSLLASLLSINTNLAITIDLEKNRKK